MNAAFEPPSEFEQWPRHVEVAPYGKTRPQRVYMWWDAERRFLVVTVRTRVVDLPVARAIVAAVDVLLDHEREALDVYGVSGIHDWRMVRSYESDARKYQQDKAKENLGGLTIHEQLIAADVNPLLHTALSVSSMVFAIVTGTPIRLIKADQLEPELRARGVSPGPPLPYMAKINEQLAAMDYIAADPPSLRP